MQHYKNNLYAKSPMFLKIIAWLICLIPFSLFGKTGSIEGRLGYFVPSSGLVKEVYHHGGVEPEIEATLRVYKELRVWANFNAFYRKGRSKELQDSTSIQLYPLSSGLKYNFRILDPFYVYLGLGPSITWAIICNHSPYVKGRVQKTCWGVVGKSGFTYYFSNHILIDLFADYSYSRLSKISRPGVESTSVNVGGLRIGLGLGWAF